MRQNSSGTDLLLSAKPLMAMPFMSQWLVQWVSAANSRSWAEYQDLDVVI